MAWACLLVRVFLADAIECSNCGARMQWDAALTDPASFRTYLTGVCLPAEPPPPRSTTAATPAGIRLRLLIPPPPPPRTVKPARLNCACSGQ